MRIVKVDELRSDFVLACHLPACKAGRKCTMLLNFT